MLDAHFYSSYVLDVGAIMHRKTKVSPMRLATMILPMMDNTGSDLADVHAALRSAACATFGGFTAMESVGGWHDDSTGITHVESGMLYQFAMKDSAEMRASLESFALFYGHMANQLAVMCTHTDGSVRIMNCHARALQGA